MSWKHLLCESLGVFLYTSFGVLACVGIAAGFAIPSVVVGIISPLLAILAIFCCKLLIKKCKCCNAIEEPPMDEACYSDEDNVRVGCKIPSAPSHETTEAVYMDMKPLPPFTSIFQPQMNYPIRDLNFGHTVGEGAFGTVVVAKAKNLTCPGTTPQVAVKMLKNNHTDSEAKDLKREFEVMQSVGYHKNIVNLLGCSFDAKNHLLIIMDFAYFGNLRNYLQTHAAIDQSDLLKFAFQVACGMQHLAAMKCFHRGLAARNVLVTEDLNMKITNFGLARDLNQEGFGETALNPFKWMAPEYLSYNVFCTQSDVWSFGVLLWELFSNGDEPYPNVDVTSLKEMLENGKRLTRPKNSPTFVYTWMGKCWNYVPAQRPTFEEILFFLKQFETLNA